MRRSRLICIALAILLGLLLVWIMPERGQKYQELTASQWESEIRHWEPWAEAWSNKTGAWRLWMRKQPLWASWLGHVGIKVSEDQYDMPLLQGDPAAVPVLTELLASRDAQVRLLAAEGLQKVDERARSAVPALLRALDDEDETVRQQVEQTLFRIDREAAERAGLAWMGLGLIRER